MTRLLPALLLCAGVAGAADAPVPAPSTFTVDIDRYAGTWYEIARMPHFFQRNCARDTTAHYLREGDAVRVTNRCVDADGEEIKAEGRARVVEPASNRKLKVGFLSIFGWYPFEGDYWILDLDPDYRWVLVGTPSREYGWILARDPQLDPALRADLSARLKALGYDPQTFTDTPQGTP
jgi:apolipoprotein D and lipocalin family protein